MIYDWSRIQAYKNGHQIAVSLEDEHITYGTLESESNKLAGLLIAGGLKPGDRVGLFLEKTPDAIVAMLGICKAGGVYIPLDYQSPAGRVMKIIRSSDLSLMFVDNHSIHAYQSLLNEAPELNRTPWIWWSAEQVTFADVTKPLFEYRDIDLERNFPHNVLRDPNSPAHILFTSGSTGQPKGVVISHKNVQTFIDWAVPYFKMTQGERTSCHSPLHFDLSTFDIYGAFCSGSRLYLVPPKISVDPGKLSRFILNNRLDQWFSVPSALAYLARFKAIPEGGFPNLKRLIWCGEVFPMPELIYWMNNLPDVQFTNLYGPTEATIASSYYTVPAVPAEGEDLPIGRPCSGENMLLLDEDMKRVKPGEKANLYISGEGLSSGYWRDRGKTDSVFIWYNTEERARERIYKTGDLASMSEDGQIWFHGRSDYQIKSRGYRIELGEIEAALGQSDAVREYAVVPVRKSGFEGTSIGCAYVGAGVENKADRDLAPLLKQELKDKIPGYMMPHFWQEYDMLPRNGNGKIDRKRLSTSFEESGRTGRNKPSGKMKKKRNEIPGHRLPATKIQA